MSIFESIKKLVIEEEPTAPPAQGTNPPPAARPGFVPTGTGIPVYQAPATIFPTAPAITFDPEKLKELRAKVHPTSGPLILFIQTLQGLQQFIPDEITRFRAAAQTLSGQGVTVNQIIAELNAVMSRIEENRTAAETAKNRKFDTEVTARENRVAEIGKTIEAKQAEIAALMQERDQVFGEAQVAKAKIEEKWAGWEAVRQTLVAEYNDSMRKLQSYFANTTTTTGAQ
jgi:hypothetical protein